MHPRIEPSIDAVLSSASAILSSDQIRPTTTRIVYLTVRGRRLHETAVGVYAQIEREWAQIVGGQRFRQLREALSLLMMDSADRAAAQTAP